MRIKVALQGIAGSFHQQAAEKLIGPDIEIVHCKTFREVFAAVSSGKAEAGAVAIENSLYGPIHDVYRLLARNSLWVNGETYLHVEQYLIGAPGRTKDLKQIRRVISQTPALGQCELWLETNLPQAHLETMHDTAESVRYVVEHADEPLAAVAGRQSAELYGGEILAGPINDEKHNYTRFFLLGKDKQAAAKADKTSIILETGHKPGALYHALGAFAEANVNLSKLDSHPIPGDQQRYAFYIDFEAGLDEQLDHPVLDTLRKQGCTVTVLGSYKKQAL